MTRKQSRRRFLQGAGGVLGLLSAGAAASRRTAEGVGESDDPRGTVRTDETSRNASQSNEWLNLVESGDRAEIDHRRPSSKLDSLSSRAAIHAPSTETESATSSPAAPPRSTEISTQEPTTTETTASGITRNTYTVMEGSPYETPVYEIEAPRRGPTTMVVAGMHGDEKAGYLAAEHVANWGVRRGTLVVLPHANVPAVQREGRYGRHGDLNRAFPPTGRIEPSTRLARALWAVVLDRDPDHLLDLHSSRAIYNGGERNGGVGQAIFPTDVRPAPRYAAKTVRAINSSLGLPSELAYDRGNLLDGDRPMLAHRFGAVLNRPGFICETVETAPLKHQVSWHLFTIDYLLSLFDHPPVVN